MYYVRGTSCLWTTSMAHAEVSRVRIQNRAVLETRALCKARQMPSTGPESQEQPPSRSLPGFKSPTEFCFHKWTAVIHLKMRGGALSVGFLKIRTLMDMVGPCAIGNSFFRNLSLGTLRFWWCHMPSFVES